MHRGLSRASVWISKRNIINDRRPFSAYRAALHGLKSPPILGSDGIVSDKNEPLYTLPAEAYTSKSIYDEEQKAIFAKTWHYVDHTSSLPHPGSYSTANVLGEEVLLVKDKDGKTIRAFYNVCSHRAHHMVEPGSSGRKPVLFCPNHAWSYKLDGKLYKARHTDGQPPFDPVEYGLKEIRLENFNGLLFLNLDPDAEPLFEYLKAPHLRSEIINSIVDMDKVKLEVKVEKNVPANWKCLVDNFLECYHCDTAHKAFVDMVDMSKYRTEIHPRYVFNYSPCKPENTAYSFKEDAKCTSINYYWIWPNTVVYSAPGPPNMSVLQFIPVSPGVSTRRAHRFFIEEEGVTADEKMAAISYLNDVLLEEDMKLCEAIQKGISSRAYKQGRFVIPKDGGWTTEKSVAQFHGLCHDSLCATS